MSNHQQLTIATQAQRWYNFPDMADRKAKPKPKTESKLSPEYRQYLKRHAEMGEDRPKLAPEEFELYEDELLDLLALNDKSMSDDEIVRIQELEYLLIDAE